VCRGLSVGIDLRGEKERAKCRILGTCYERGCRYDGRRVGRVVEWGLREMGCPSGFIWEVLREVAEGAGDYETVRKPFHEVREEGGWWASW
jgi:hypothetical protein